MKPPFDAEIVDALRTNLNDQEHIQEYMAFAPETLEVFHGGANGMLNVAGEPGLGVHYDDKAAERFHYDPKYLPVARRLDGSVHDW